MTFAPFDDDGVAASAVAGLRSLIEGGRVKRLQLERVDGTAIAASRHATSLAGLGFHQAFKGYVLGPA